MPSSIVAILTELRKDFAVNFSPDTIYLQSDNPIVSMDTKMAELIGNFYRSAHLLAQGVIATLSTTTSPAPPRA